MTELEFLKILVPRLPKNKLNVNNEYVGKSKLLYSLCDYNHFDNILRLCDVLTDFRFTTSETMNDYYS